MSCGGCKGVTKIFHGAVGLAKAALGLDAVSVSVREARLDRCRVCEHATRHPTKRTAAGLPLVRWCRACRCWLDAKTRVASESCPIGSWTKSLDLRIDAPTQKITKSET